MSALCGPAQASSVFAFHMTLSRLLSLSPEAPVIAESGIERYCLALAIYHEARGEPLPGQFAVAVTIINRVRSNAYPDTVCGVVYQNAARLNRCQFSFACDRRSDVPQNPQAFERALNMAEFANTMKANLGNDPAAGSPFAMLSGMTHYHRHDAKPAWSKKLQRLAHIGSHVFFSSDRVVRKYRKAEQTAPTEIAAISR